MFDTKHKTNVAATETNVWDVILELYKSRAELVSKVVSFASAETKVAYQEQIDDIDHRVEYLLEV